MTPRPAYYASAIAVLSAVCLSAQSEMLPLKAVVDSSGASFRAPRTFVLRAAERMPEEHYAFRPTPEVRTFAQLLGHIADGYRLVCATAVGDSLPPDIQENEKTKTGKAELIAALTQGAEYCDRAHERLGGAKGAEMIKWGGREQPRATVLFANTSHAWHHYGNVVTYLRLKGIVPPSSDSRPTSPRF
jgi:uncharacterized damage-inducible protein DinB